MRSQHLPMSRQEFFALPRKPGWRYEYIGGQAHITPRPYKVRVARPLEERPGVRSLRADPEAVPPPDFGGAGGGPWTLRPPTEADIPPLIDLYAAAFEDTYDYCDREPEEVRADAAREVPRTFGGDEYGWFLAYASRVAEVDGRAVGALLVTEYEGQPHLTYLFVLPAWQRKGLATALVQSAANALRDAGYTELTSTYRPGNEPSRAWHTKFGFVEVMD